MKRYFLLCAITLIWGSQFMCNAVALKALPPTEIAWLRALIGAILLSIILGVTTSKQPTLRSAHWVQLQGYCALASFFEITLPQLLITWGQQYVSSSTTSILIATIPIFTVFMLLFYPQGERIRWNQMLAVLVGFLGVLVLLAPNVKDFSLQNDYLLGEISILLGAASFALSLLLLKKIAHLPPVRCVRNILLWAVIQLGIILLWDHNAWHFTPTAPAITAIVILGVFASGIVYVLLFQLLKLAGTHFTALCNYLIPIVGLVLGIMILHEPFTLSTLMALLIILAALVINERTKPSP